MEVLCVSLEQQKLCGVVTAVIIVEFKKKCTNSRVHFAVQKKDYRIENSKAKLQDKSANRKKRRRRKLTTILH